MKTWRDLCDRSNYVLSKFLLALCSSDRQRNIGDDDVVNLNELTNNIKKWAIARNLHSADPTKQMLKLGEEYGELCQAIAKDRKKAAVKDAIGDMYVVLTNLSLQMDIEIEECIEMAYEEIKFRKGKMVNGVFVKESDL